MKTKNDNNTLTLAYENSQTVIAKLEGHSTQQPNKTAITFGALDWSYSRLWLEVLAWSVHVSSQTKCGDLVLIFLPQGPDAIASFFGVMHAGAVPSFMPLPSAKQDSEVYWRSHQQLLELIAPVAIVTNGSHAAELYQVFPRSLTKILVLEDILAIDSENRATVIPFYANAEDTALLQHSSGTTGLKKGVALSHQAIVRQVEIYSQALGANSSDVVVSWLPLYHDMGLVACTLMPLMLGQTLVLLDPFEWVIRPVSLFEAITIYGGTLVWLPNFSFDHLRRAVRKTDFEFELSSVRGFINCSEPCKAQTFDRFVSTFAEWGISFNQLQVCYAMAETVFALSQTRLGESVRRLRVQGDRLLTHEVVPDPDGDVELLSCGQLLQGCSVEISQTTDYSAGGGQEIICIGEIVVSTPFLFEGYYKRPEQTQEVLHDMKYHTRDLGFMHEGELYVLGRKDDLLISNGRNYFAHEIEQIANLVEGVKAGRNVAIGLFNPEIGSEEIYLVQEVGKMSDIQAKTLRRFVREAVQQQLGLALRDVVLVPAGWLTKTTSGKISRESNEHKLVEMLANNSIQ